MHERQGQTDDRQTDDRQTDLRIESNTGTSRIVTFGKICALCEIFRAISVPLTTENSDDFEIPVPDGSGVRTQVIESYTMNSSCVISC